MRSIEDIKRELLHLTSGGLNIIMSIYPQANTRHHFKIRDERTPSCSLTQMKDGNWVVKDWGGGGPARNGIQIYAEENGLSFTQAVLQLARQYNINTGNDDQKNEAKFRKIDLSEWDQEKEFDDTGFYYETKEFTETELKVLGPFVTADVCAKYALFSLKFYATKKDGRITIVEPTESFPIFIFVFGDKDNKYYKILQPKSEDKKWRFFWKGKKESNFIGGLNVLEKAYAKRKQAEIASMEDDAPGDVEEAKKIEQVFLCSGERDALNMASLGYFVLWQNSETADLKGSQYKRIMGSAETLYNIPDLDETGRREGQALAMKYLEIRTLWLPDWITKKRDWRGNPRKDLCDFFELNRYSPKKVVDYKIKDLIKTAYPMQFWDKIVTKNSVKYEVNGVHVFNFLKQNGFCKLDAPHDKETFKYVHVDEHIVREIKSINIKEFVNDFAEKRRLDTAIRNMLYFTTRLGDAQMTALPRVELDFTNTFKDGQLFFFSDSVWKVTAKGITPLEHNSVNKYVFERDTIDSLIAKKNDYVINTKAIKVEHPYFRISKKDGLYDIQILENDCEFLNFLIQTSRIYWKEEIDGLNADEVEEYYKTHKFAITSERLSDEQNAEQKAHLVNKIFTLGYLSHHYKTMSKPWLVYILENGLIGDDESKGGSGKSLLLKALTYMMNSKTIGARNPKIWENNHLMEGVTEQTKFILFDDADKYFNFKNMYTFITGDVDVNPKNQQQYSIPYSKAPKFAITSNYSLREKDQSTFRRILFVTTSDYYHSASDEYEEERTPRDDFGHDLFRDWNDFQWNKMLNFFAQALSFHLTVKEKINPPMDGVELRSLQSHMGPSFMEWADYYLTNNLDKEFNKRLALEDLRSRPDSRHTTATLFKERIISWCKFNGHTFMPKEATDKNGRIQRKTDEGKIEDFYLIKKGEHLFDEDIEPIETPSKKLPF